MDTPRTNVGDATYLSRPPDFDISQEASFQSPSKDPNVFQQLRNGARPNLRTPRGRGPLRDRRNLPEGIGGVEFTPLLKSATRSSSRRYSGKENGLATPAVLDKIEEDMTPVPAAELSSYGISRNASYLARTPLPEVDSSSLPSTPMVMKARRAADGPLQDDKQLSLREQENVINRIETENFGLKLKIHFLEEALHKTGPDFNEAALKENTDLKVDKVTMQRELHRYKKHLTSAEKDLENYRQQILEMQERAKKRIVDEAQRGEVERLRQALKDREADIEDLQRQLDQDQKDSDRVDKLQDEIADLEADVREKDRIINQHEDELEDLRLQSDKAERLQDEIGDLETGVREKDRLLAQREDELQDLRLRAESAEGRMKDSQRRMVGLEEKAQAGEKLREAKDTIADLEADVRRLEQQVEDVKDKLDEAVSEKERAEGDLEELQEEMANKSVVTKGLSRQVEEKLARLQNEVDNARHEYGQLEQRHDARQKEADDLKAKLKESRQARDAAEHESRSAAAKLEDVQADLNTARDQKSLLQARHDALTNESALLQRDVAKLEKTVSTLEEDLRQERQHALNMERDIRSQFKDDIQRLNDEISDLQAEVREKDNLYDKDSEKWETERRTLESERDGAVERVSALQRTADRLREAEGSLSSKEARLQEAVDSETERHRREQAVLNRQLLDLRQDLDARQKLLEDVRSELSGVRDELRQSQLDCGAQRDKVEGLEDEVEVLQTTLDDESEKARQEQTRLQEEMEHLKKQMTVLRESAESVRASTAASHESARHRFELVDKLQIQVTDATASITRISKEKQGLQDQLANTNLELHSLRTSLAETKAERDEIEGQLRRLNEQEDDTFRLDQERLNLRTAKTKLDNEVRRLREENKSLTEQRLAVEKSLDDEVEKAAAEEDRLGHEIRQLQAKLRQSSDKESLAASRRTIRELERRIGDYEAQLAATAPLAANLSEGTSDVSLVRRDLSDARAREKEYLQRESGHKETVRALKRQIADLERAAHQADMDRLAASPQSEPDSGRKTELAELRRQLSAAHQSSRDLKKALRDAERQAEGLATELQSRVDDAEHQADELAAELRSRVGEAEEQKLLLEQALEEAHAAAEEAAETHEAAAAKYKGKLERYRRERDELAEALAAAENQTAETDASTRERRKDLHALLRKTQVEAEALEREVHELQTAQAEAQSAEETLRAKLDRARAERAEFRADAERLQHEVASLRASRPGVVATGGQTTDDVFGRVPTAVMSGANGGTTTPAAAAVPVAGEEGMDSLVRAAEEQRLRHDKELRGLAMQIEWMQARWEREAMLREGAASAKRYLSLELEMRLACNKADLSALHGILGQLGVKEPPRAASRLALLPPAAASLSSSHRSGSSGSSTAVAPAPARRFTLAHLAIVLRAVARMRLAARAWARHEHTRARLAAVVEASDKQKRIRRMRDEWRAGADDRRRTRALAAANSSSRDGASAGTGDPPKHVGRAAS